jgi:hypothetical protein
MYSCDKGGFGPWRCFRDHEVFCGTDHDFILQFDDEPSLVFLDGPHDYDSVLAEVSFFLKRLREYGVIFIHDTYPPDEDHLRSSACETAYKIRQRLEEERIRENLQVFTWPWDCGLTMAMKLREGRPYYQS